jgi:hypothetical protein
MWYRHSLWFVSLGHFPSLSYFLALCLPDSL